ncbi:MAG: sulfotransferase family protein [Acidobacteriota bacterium]
MDLGVLYCFARSGGTLINRCLGCIPGNLVLSEVNPQSAVLPIENQARDWLSLISPDEYEEFSKQPYGLKIRILWERAQKQNHALIIRDWPTLNFLENAYCGYFCPSGILEQEVYLARHRIPMRRVVVTRRAAAVYESMTRSFDHLRSLDVEVFGAAYLAYAKSVAGFPIFHFEEFCANPFEVFRRLGSELGSYFAETFASDFKDFDRCTGDNRLLSPSRAGKSEVIVRLSENEDSPQWRAAQGEPNCREADSILGYAN